MAPEIKYEIFTLRKEKTGRDGHWQTTEDSPYADTNSIEESNSSSITEPTSIPSPFARMELARTAFEIASSHNTWDEVPNVYKKIVSDCLDVAEIFFNYPMYKDYVDIIKWDKNSLNGEFGNTEVGKSMKRFMQSDSNYNFDKMSAIYLLNYKGNNRPNKSGLNIIGATSPITMFFSVGNDLSYVGENIHFTNQDKPFDLDFNPLEKRDPQFIHWLDDIVSQYNNDSQRHFESDFKAFREYIKASINRLNQFTSNANWNYAPISFNNGNDSVEVLGFKLGQANEKVPTNSDFEINSNLITDGKLPLILPTGKGYSYKDCSYIDINDKWGDCLSAPQSDEKALDERILPGRTIKYPYLTVSDFFEDTIIKMPHKLNSGAYFNLNIKGDINDKSYLLPFKSLLFEYFTVEQVMSMVETKIKDESVTITLNIPIKNYSKKAEQSFVSYEKIYQQNKNEFCGNTIETNFGLGIFPLVRTNDVNVANYRVAVLDKVDISNVEFYNGNKKVTDVKNRIRRERKGKVCGINTYVIKQQYFDRIDIQIGNNHGYIIPIFNGREGTKKFRFAVDFGTTNTHIAYDIDNEKGATALECAPQMQRLHVDYGDYSDIPAAFDYNYVPVFKENNLKKSFPIRSVFAEVSTIDYNGMTYTLCDGNIPFNYEEDLKPFEYLNIQTGDNLKWSANKERIRLYIENIAFMLHNKVLLEGGSLKNTEISWFYPASMSTNIKSAMDMAWNNAYKLFFDNNYNENTNKISSMSESIAPYCHYIGNDGAQGVVVTIDIGGGTTDVYISNKHQNTDTFSYLMSFRFASNSLFGNGYNSNINQNGFVNKYKGILEESCDDNMKNFISRLHSKGDSSELISYFFSLSSIGNPGLNFLDKLSDDTNYKYIFLIFYSAIIYHIAQAMKAKNIEMPQTVAFSGNGSKTLQVISKDTRILEEFVKNIFEKVYEDRYPEDRTFIFRYDKEKPKEATAKGGLKATTQQKIERPSSLVLLGVDNKTFVENKTYDEISNDEKAKIVDTVKGFIDFITTLNERDNRKNLFGDSYGLNVQRLSYVLGICKKDLDNYLDQGITKINQLLSEDKTATKEIKESLFFYPIVGMLNNLATKLYELDSNN